MSCLQYLDGVWDGSCCFVRCYFQDLFRLARCILFQFLYSFLSMLFVSIHVVHPYSSIDTATALKKSRFILSDVHVFARRILISLLSDEILLPMYVNLPTNFRCSPLRVQMTLSLLKLMYSVLFAFTWRPLPPAACSRLCSRDSAWADVFTRSARSSA